MRKLIAPGIVCLLMVSTLARAGSLVGGGDGFLFNFDENGNATIAVNGGPMQTVVGQMLPDPTGRVAGNVLTYILPAAAVPFVNGDLRVWDDAARTNISDILVFTNAAGNLFGATGDRMIFLSQPGQGDLADTGFGTINPFNDPAGDDEGTVEVNGVIDWLPDGQHYNPIGFPRYGGNEYYTGIITIPVPLPSSVWAGSALLGIVSLGSLARRHRSSSAA